MRFLDTDRKKYIYICTAVMILVLVISIILLVIYMNKNKKEYIYYSENANIDYKVELVENKYFEEEYLKKDNQYIADLIDEIVIDFDYQMDVDEELEYNYKYKIVSNMNIVDKATNKVLYTSSDEIIPEEIDVNKGKIDLSERVEIDFGKYNDFCTEFVNVYNLKNSVCKLSTIMYINVDKIDDTDYSMLTVDIPLNENTFSINYTNNLITSDKNYNEVISTSQSGIIFLIASIVLFIIDIVILIFFLKYIKSSQTEEEVYDSKLKKILNKYESCISKVEEEFSMADFRMIKVQSFEDLLEIRDTMRLPIMMLENKEKRMTCFTITTENNILYFFSIGVMQYALPVYDENKETIEAE